MLGLAAQVEFGLPHLAKAFFDFAGFAFEFFDPLVGGLRFFKHPCQPLT